MACRSTNKSTCGCILKKLPTTEVRVSRVVLGVICSVHTSIYTVNMKA